jgi:hypothetical protein
MLFAGFLSLLPGEVVKLTPRSAHLHLIKISYLDYFVVSSLLLPRTLRRCLLQVSSIWTISQLLRRFCIATAPPCNKLMPRRAKSTPYLACHRDYFVAKAPGQVAGWLRQVTQTPFIAGPLVASRTIAPKTTAN